MLACVTWVRRHRELCRFVGNCLAPKSINLGSHTSRSEAVDLQGLSAFVLQRRFAHWAQTTTIGVPKRQYPAAIVVWIALLAAVIPLALTGQAAAIEPQGGTWKTWVIGSGPQFHAPPPPAAAGPEPDPLSVVQALMDAERAANLDAAMALFAADAFILNVTGWKTANKEELKWFINAETWMREDFALNHHRVAGNRVTWDEEAAESFYQGIGVAPVQFVFEATIKSGKIKSIIAHLPAGEIARIGKACRAQAKEPLIHGRPCSEFVELVEAHTKRHSGIQAQRAPSRFLASAASGLRQPCPPQRYTRPYLGPLSVLGI